MNNTQNVIPSPRSWPLVGHLPQLQSKGIIAFLEDAWRRHGDVFRVKMGVEMTVVAHPRGLEHILSKAKGNYVKGAPYDTVRRVVGSGVLILEGDSWVKRRRLMAPSFHRTALAEMAKTMVEFGARYFEKLKARSKHDQVVDIHAAMVELTLDVVVATLFGTDLIEAAHVNPEALGTALEVVGSKLNGVPIPEWLPTAANRRAKAMLQEVDDSVGRVIAAARAKPAPDGTLLSMLLQTVDEETGDRLTDKELRDEVLTLFLAGHETTALTLTWLFVLLEGHPEIAKRLRDETAEVLGGREPEFSDVPKLKYTRQVVDETLRIRSPAAMVSRTAVKDDEIMGYPIAAGTAVMPYFWGVHRHRDFWSKPESFDPDRFSEANSAGRDRWCYLPFSGGHRVCIGNTFSLVESVLLVAMMMQRFEVEAVPGPYIEPVAVATVRPSRPVNVHLHWR